MVSALFCSVYPWGVILLLSLLIHDGLHGWAGNFLHREFFALNRTIPPNQNVMLSIYHFDDSGPDRN